MAGAFLTPQERKSWTMTQQLIQNIVGPAAHARQKLYFSVPAAPPGTAENLTFHEATLRQMIGELGFEAHSVSEGLAVVYSELESSNYTGIGISLGGRLCDICMAYLAVPVIDFS